MSLYLLVPVVVVAFAFLLWWFAAVIGRVIAGAGDPVVLQGSINREDLFSLGILVMGLWTALTYLGLAASWIHYLVISKKLAENAQTGDMRAFYDGMNNIVPCVAGALLTVAARPLGRRLAKIGPIPPSEGKNG